MQHRLTVFTLNWVQEAAMDRTIELTLEQEFSLRNFADQVKQMSREQAQEFLLVQYKHMMIQETTYQELLKKDWKLERFNSLET
jgi:Phycobilisome degradation protein nblA